ncbi:HAD family hydrolase [Candidatus Woesearchaeota archaeon]|nr:HAD family hydrolase [Candidatus Woesearchaeota archaeon]MBW3021451.1 HAD family hydrolase [Candidatus Woesearchaeota archaeon]
MKAIIFDFDNTLDDFASVKRKAEQGIADYLHKKHDILPDYFVKKFEEIDLQISHCGAVKRNPKLYDRYWWFKEFFCLTGMKVGKKEIDSLVQMYWNYINKKAKLLPHVKSTLNYLKKRYTLVVMSDSDGKRSLKIDRIKAVGIYDVINLIVLGDDVKINKPSLKYYDYILRRLKLKARDCVMVGDKPEVDLRLAKKLGMKTVWIKHGSWSKQLKGKKFSYVDYTVTDFKQLRKIF